MSDAADAAAETPAAYAAALPDVFFRPCAAEDVARRAADGVVDATARDTRLTRDSHPHARTHASLLPRCAELEAAGYPADEAASPERLAYRQRRAGDFFWVAHDAKADDGGVVGFVCGTLCRGDALTAETMGTHDAEGTTLCVHSVCVDHAARRRGVASSLLRAYLRLLPGVAPALRSVRLIAKPHLTPLYTRAGFTLLGPSPVVHGEDAWLEFCHRFEEDEQPQQ
jgi:GNAT superfamily N-acetyltransferase